MNAQRCLKGSCKTNSHTSSLWRQPWAGPRTCRVRSRGSHVLVRGFDYKSAQARLETLLSQEAIELLSPGPTQPLGFSSPSVDWSRYHVQLLFVDRTDTLRARVAAGVFDRIAEWNGFGRAMYTWSCGLEADSSTSDSLSTPSLSLSPPQSQPQSISPQSTTTTSTNSQPHPQGKAVDADADMDVPDHGSTSHGAGFTAVAARMAAVLSAATALKLPIRDVARPVERFELEDLDRYELVLCMDRSIREAILNQVAPTDREYYEEKVCLLTGFSRYESDSVVLARGGFALLPAQLSFLLRTGPKDLSTVKLTDDIYSPELSGPEGMAQWSDMVQAIICCTAGLVKYLMDAMPEDHWEPQD